MIGATFTGGSGHAIVAFAHMPDSLLAIGWIVKSFTSLDGKAVTKTLHDMSQLSKPLMLFLQPWLWAFGAVAAGMIRDDSHERRQPAAQHRRSLSRCRDPRPGRRGAGVGIWDYVSIGSGSASHF